ncbi:hypothetical protein A3A59_00290, partial [Candidatus Gottesmanbacteria bacterium RIFCSPLOWO2_01_FULL_42_10]
LADVPIEIVSLFDLSINQKPEEVGKTFKENTILKAKFYQKLSGLPTLVDDGGFEIDALGGEPGIKSHRWVDSEQESSDEELITYTMKRLIKIPLEKRGAQLRLVLALVLPDGKIYTAEAKIRGIVPLKPGTHRTEGFPYRSLLFLPEINKFYDQQLLTVAENERYNHRKKAVEQLKPIISTFLTS